MARCNYGQLRLLAWACIWSREDSHVLWVTITSPPLCFCVFICTSLPNYNTSAFAWGTGATEPSETYPERP